MDHGRASSFNSTGLNSRGIVAGSPVGDIVSLSLCQADPRCKCSLHAAWAPPRLRSFGPQSASSPETRPCRACVKCDTSHQVSDSPFALACISVHRSYRLELYSLHLQPSVY
eukprot:5608587-Prymnesium_polylepis.1